MLKPIFTWQSKDWQSRRKKRTTSLPPRQVIWCDGCRNLCYGHCRAGYAVEIKNVCGLEKINIVSSQVWSLYTPKYFSFACNNKEAIRKAKKEDRWWPVSVFLDFMEIPALLDPRTNGFNPNWFIPNGNLPYAQSFTENIAKALLETYKEPLIQLPGKH